MNTSLLPIIKQSEITHYIVERSDNNIHIEVDAKSDLPERRFLITIRQRAVSFVSKRIGGKSCSIIDLASILKFCHLTSLNNKI